MNCENKSELKNILDTRINIFQAKYKKIKYILVNHSADSLKFCARVGARLYTYHTIIFIRYAVINLSSFPLRIKYGRWKSNYTYRYRKLNVSNICKQ